MAQSKNNDFKQNSFLLPYKIATLEKKMIIGKMGAVEKHHLIKILEKFKNVFHG